MSTDPGSREGLGGLAEQEVPSGPGAAIRTFLCGFAMGAADIVPGVSGGTVALILGVYERLVRAITRFDAFVVRSLLLLRVRDAWRHADGAFVAALAAGIGTGILSLASLLNRLLTTEGTRGPTLAVFFGVIAMSSVLVLRLARESAPAPGGAPSTSSSRMPFVFAVAGAVGAFWLTGLRSFDPGEPTLPWAFMSGAVAICAMILPGISGAFLLLLLGMYLPITGILRRLPSLDLTASDFTLLAVFSVGCATGLLAFSRVLKWLLARHLGATLGLLAGFMVGSLRKIWPFQRDVTLDNLDRAGLTPEEVETIRSDPARLAEVEVDHRVYENELPAALDLDVLVAVGAAIAAAALVYVIDSRVGARGRGRAALGD